MNYKTRERVTSEKGSTFLHHTIGSDSVQRASPVPEDGKPKIKEISQF